jgi:hypothetical protein
MIYLIIISVLFGLGRFFIQGHDVSWPGTYEAFAHIWVGILLVFCFSKVKEVRWIPRQLRTSRRKDDSAPNSIRPRFI